MPLGAEAFRQILTGDVSVTDSEHVAELHAGGPIVLGDHPVNKLPMLPEVADSVENPGRNSSSSQQ
jgi:hypothetical protein